MFAVGNPASQTGLKFARDVVFVEGHGIQGAGLELRDLTLADGSLSELGGAGIDAALGTFVRLEDATVENNRSDGQGAGILNYGYMVANRIRVTGNRTKQAAQGGQTGVGGGIMNQGILLLSDSLVDHNFGGHGGGLTSSDAGAEAFVTNTSFVANTASGGGAGVRAALAAT